MGIERIVERFIYEQGRMLGDRLLREMASKLAHAERSAKLEREFLDGCLGDALRAPWFGHIIKYKKGVEKNDEIQPS